MPQQAAIARLLALITLVVASGCQPLGVSWAPDSGSFVFAIGPRQDGFAIARYDLKTKSAQVIRERTATVVPAAGPDGKQLATAEIVRGKPWTRKVRTVLDNIGLPTIGVPGDRKIGLQIVFSGMDGKELSKSSLLPLGRVAAGKESAEFDGLTGLIWGADDRFLVAYLSNEFEKFGTAAYSGRERKWKSLEDVLPWATAGVSPILPQGRGVVALRIQNRQPASRPADPKMATTCEPVLVDLEGVVRDVLTPDGKRVTLEEFAEPSAARWDGDVLVLLLDDQSVHLDTAQATWTAKPLPPPATQPALVRESIRNQSPIVTSYTFPRTGMRVVVRTIDIKKENQRGSLPRLRKYHVAHGYEIAVCKPGADEVIETIMSADSDDDFFGMKSNNPLMMLFPSPDGTRLAAHCSASGSVDTIAVVDERGTVIDTFKCAALLENK